MYNSLICKFVIFTIFIFQGFESTAQIDSILLLNCYTGQGYLVLKDPSIPIKCWTFDFYEKEYFGDSIHEFNTNYLNRYTVCGKNYFKVPLEYTSNKTRDIRVSISGQDQYNQTIVFGTDIGIGIFPAPPGQKRSIPLCGAICDGNWLGNTYAYENRLWGYIDVNDDLTGSGFISSTTAYRVSHGNIQIPYYGYYTPAQANLWVTNHYPNNTIQSLHNIAPNDFSILLNTTNLGAGISIKDPYNNFISGAYYMIRKDMGQWANYSTYMISSDFQLPVCNFTLGYSNSIINSSSLLISSGGPLLVCNGNGFSLSVGEDSEFDTDCLPSELITELDENYTPFDILNQIDDCLDGGETNVWWENIDYAELAPIYYGPSSPSNPIWSFNGIANILNNPVILTEGLYWLNTHTKKANYYSILVEAKENFNFYISQKDLINVIIFPVPHTEDEFSISLNSPFSGKLKYELHNSNGELFYSQMIEFNSTTSNNSYIIKINPNQTLPLGVLIHKFILEDNSVLTLNTTNTNN